MKQFSMLILMASAAFNVWAVAPSDAAAPVALSSDTRAIADTVREPVTEAGLLRANALGDGSDDIAGSLQTPSGALSFQTKSQSAGQMATKGIAPQRVQIRLEINGAVIDHEMDYGTQTMTVRTSERVVIDENDRAVFRSFQTELGRSLSQQGGTQRLPKSQDVLWRLAEMYSEVPLGKAFAAEWVIRRSDAKPIAQPVQDSAASGTFLPGVPQQNSQPLVVAAACTEKGGGSFTNLRNAVDVCDDDRTFYRASAHDYCPAHGYSTKTVAYGCGASSCPGRCGAGCGVADGLGAWYQDCLDHDICNRDHNSQLGACGDEWTEAADDYAFGAISCYTTCN